MKRQLVVVACVVWIGLASVSSAEQRFAENERRLLNTIQVGQSVLLNHERETRDYRLRLLDEGESAKLVEYRARQPEFIRRIESELEEIRAEKQQLTAAMLKRLDEVRSGGSKEEFSKDQREIQVGISRLENKMRELGQQRFRGGVPEELEYLRSDLMGQLYSVTAIGDDYVGLQNGKTEMLIPASRIAIILRKAPAKEK